jgi:hypothetical protein
MSFKSYWFCCVALLFAAVGGATPIAPAGVSVSADASQPISAALARTEYATLGSIAEARASLGVETPSGDLGGRNRTTTRERLVLIYACGLLLATILLLMHDHIDLSALGFDTRPARVKRLKQNMPTFGARRHRSR